MTEKVAQLEDILSAVAATDFYTLFEKQGAGRFKVLESKMKMVVQLAQLVTIIDLTTLSEPELELMIRNFSAVRVRLSAIATWDESAHVHAKQAALQVADATGKDLDAFLQQTATTMVRVLTSASNWLSNLKDSTDVALKRLEGIGAISNEMVKHRREAEGILRSLRELAQQRTVASFENHFNDRAVDHTRSAKRWFIGAIALSIITIGIMFLFALHPKFELEGDWRSAVHVQQIATRLVTVSMLYLGVIWCMKNYCAHQHMRNVNLHRGIALAAFETLMKAAGSDVMLKKTVLIEACGCMFAPTVTGFLGPDENTPGSPAGEIAKVLASK